MSAEEEAYHLVCAYTLTHGDPRFIHQHVVDAWAAQRADAQSKPIGVFFALVGLYLHVECGLSGRDVQRMHMQLARTREPWPVGALPAARGDITVLDVARAAEGAARDAMIHRWCEAVWETWTDSRSAVIQLLQARGIATGASPAVSPAVPSDVAGRSG